MTGTLVVLTIAGSDPSGGAGIQADLKTFASHGCYGASVITALTAQNTTGVKGIHPCPPQFVEQQINSVLDDLDVRAMKTGMLHDAEIIKAVVDSLKGLCSSSKLPPLVCDPVCVSTSGHTLLQEDALKTMITDLFPLSTLITPNKSEGELLLSRMGVNLKIENLDTMLAATETLLSSGCQAVLLKGGHITARMKDVVSVQERFPDLKVIKQGLLGENMEILLDSSQHSSFDDPELVVDILLESEKRTTLFVHPRVDSSCTHGTGCTLSSAIASELAKGSSLVNAVKAAESYTHLGIQCATPIGKGHGPLNHLHNIRLSLIPRRTSSNPYPFTQMLIESAATSWKEYVEHDFVRQLGKGTLDRSRFVHFIKQDYLYLKYYARAYGLLAAKSSSFGSIQSSTQTILNILHEIGNHKMFCLTFGITEEDLEKTPESPATTAYGAYILDTGLQGDTTKLIMALIACLLGYGEVGLWLKKQSNVESTWVVLEGNPYKHWIEEYSGEMYQEAVRMGLETIESCAVADPPSEARLNEWKAVWERCTKLEKGFWDMAMELR
ncbi:hypothetical protein GALMADRAFT_60054 [Galerina marginata CBS 339.88]|uniref:Pyridoxamine kinase/Phosphomethylpyrimidine kinase domain-containing protein n=1 Tax=Galerina marginata (strain CBS 339.88) TaxID=685588 RepID=A0A067TFV0_GALM3|nr:hypothetical protein GALMADRAFT_60054 [Galerina marginata CBS 339.88]